MYVPNDTLLQVQVYWQRPPIPLVNIHIDEWQSILPRTYLHLLIFEREEGGWRQETDYCTGHNEDRCPHRPIQRRDTRWGVFARVTSLGARQALEHHLFAVQWQFALGRKEEIKIKTNLLKCMRLVFTRRRNSQNLIIKVTFFIIHVHDH